MRDISLRELLEAGCHFGHQKTRWNPKMKPYIFVARDRIHIFDLVKTKEGLETAAAFARETTANGGQIIFVGTKRQSEDIVRAQAQRVGMPYITERWVGGLITNWTQLKKRINRLADLKAGVAENRFKDRTKKERLLIKREIAKLERIFGGVSGLKNVPAAIFVADARKDAGAIKEANDRGVKVIAIVDTNANPDGVDFVIPANDDASKCLQLIVGHIAEAVEEGLAQKEGRKAKEAEKAEAKEEKAGAKPEEKKEEKKEDEAEGKKTKEEKEDKEPRKAASKSAVKEAKAEKNKKTATKTKKAASKTKSKKEEKK
jgi:small subunit ribosomal protein S2